MTIGNKIDALFKLREQKAAIEAKLKSKIDEIDTLEGEIIAAMDAQSVVKSTGGKATVSISSRTRYTVEAEQWDAFYAFIHRHRYYHLLERRPAQLACEELMQSKGKIPGVVPFTQRKLNFRSL